MNQLATNAKDLIKQGFLIPPKPEILTAIQNIINSDDPSLADVAELISQDVGLSAGILKAINSPLYGMSRTVTDMRQASFLLGFETINSIVSGLLLRQAFSSKSGISLERFWDTATETANAMLYICNSLKDEIPQEDLYAIGMFHDCGIAALSIKHQDYKNLLMVANANEGARLIELEETAYQTNHAVIGYFIAVSWGLPAHICQIILRHHDLGYLNHVTGCADQLAYASLKTAENIISQVRREKDCDDWPYIREQVFETLGIDDQLYLELLDDIDDSLSQDI